MHSRPKRYSIALSWVILLSVLLSSCGALAGLGLGNKVPSPPDLPAPPPIPQLTANDPATRAAELANLIASATNENELLAAWLAVYQAVGIPVIDEAGAPVTDTGDDPVGAPYWQVWYASGLDDVTRGIRLADAGKILSMTPEWAYDANAGQVLLADLRAAAVSPDPYIQLLGLFIRERIYQSSSHLDLMGTNVSLDLITIDLASVQLLSWALFRAELYTIVTTARTPGSLHLASPPRISSDPSKLSASPRCAEMFGSEDTSTIVNWILNTYNGGLDIPQTKGFKGMLERGMEGLGVSEDRIGQIKGIQSRVSGIASVISFAMQLRALEVEADASGGPLERYKESREGREKEITFRLYYDKERAQGDELWACMASFLSSNLGVNFKLPSAEAISGAEMTISPGKNIPDKVLFQNGNNPSMTSNGFRYTTNSNGVITVVFTGKARSKDLPESAHQIDDTFTVHVSAQPEAVTGSSIFSTFWDSFAFWSAPTPAGAVAPIVDIMKTFSYDLGEMEFGLLDWEPSAYRAGGRMSGTFCLLAPSTLDGDKFIFHFNPASEEGGSMSFNFGQELSSLSGCNETGTGDYSVMLADDKKSGTVTWSASAALACPGLGSFDVFNGSHSFDITIDPEASCGD
jgi:hypothetical protein